MAALTILGNINYAINDWGISEAFEEGWIDELYKEYNEDLDAWINALKTEVDENTPEGAECVKAAEMIKDALYNKVKFVMECPECEGYGEVGYGENEHGCGYCGGDGYVETDEYDQVDFKNNNLWAEKWNKEYCQAINDDLIQTFFDDDGNVKADINKDERTTMKINENQKVTLTIGQLKKLVSESTKGSKIIHRCDSTTYRHIYAVPNYKDHEVVLFGVDTKEALEELLVSEFSVDETHAGDLADKLWNLKPQSSGSYFSRIV